MLSIESPAKINLFLEITERRSDGFHNLESVFQTIPLFDTLTLIPAKELTLTADTDTIPTDMRNLVLQAATLLQRECGIKEGGQFHLTKKIPSSGGLGGGSSNAASALILANELWKTNLTQSELATLAGRIGSDVAFFIYGGTCICEGRGEIVTPLADIAPLPIKLIAPEWGISTPIAFSQLDSSRFNKVPIHNFIDTLQSKPQELHKIYQNSFNHFEEIVYKIEPRQRALHELLIKNNALARMSGSGSCIWVLDDQEDSLTSIIPESCKVIL